MSDPIQDAGSVTSSSSYAPPQTAAVTEALNNVHEVISFREKVDFLRKESYWVGSKPRQDVVENLYSLSTTGNISADRWNMYGNAASPWSKQAPAIKNLKTDIEPPEIKDPPAATAQEAPPSDEGSSNDYAAKVSQLRDRGYWIGKNPRQDLVTGLHDAAFSGKLTAYQWNKMGDSSKSWEKQSGQLKGFLGKTTVAAVPENPVEDVAEPPHFEPPPEPTRQQASPNKETIAMSYAHMLPNEQEIPSASGPQEKTVPTDSRLTKEEAVHLLDVARSSGYDHVHTVRSGENISNIAELYGTSVQRILWDNKNTVQGMGSDLEIGKELVIKGSELTDGEKEQIQSHYNGLVRQENIKGFISGSPDIVKSIRTGVLGYYSDKGSFYEIEEKAINEFISSSLAGCFEGSAFFHVKDDMAGVFYQPKLNDLIRSESSYQDRPIMEMHLDMAGSDEMRIFYRDSEGDPKVWTKNGGVQDSSHSYWFAKLGNNYVVEFGAINTFAKGIIADNTEDSAVFDAYVKNQLEELGEGMAYLGIEAPVFVPGHGGTSKNSFLKIASKGSMTGASFNYDKDQVSKAIYISQVIASDNADTPS